MPHFTIKWLRAASFSFDGGEHTKRRLWRNLVIDFTEMRTAGDVEMITTNDAFDFIILYHGDLEDAVLATIKHRIEEEGSKT